MPWLGRCTYGTTKMLHWRSPVGPVHDGRTECAVRISRKTGYKWLDRSMNAGVKNWRSKPGAGRAVSAQNHRRSGDADLRGPSATPSWGPEKLLDWLGPRHPTVDLPAVSTAGDLLARKLVKKRRRRRHFEHPGVVPITTAHRNDLWTADFKGDLRTRDGVYRYPLTVADEHARYLLACHGLLSTKGLGVRPIFDRLFREYRLRNAIRTDNGDPFATTGIHGLFAAQCLVAAARHSASAHQPASPQENGAHERMHKTLKAEAIRPPQATLAPQQRAFNRFHAEHNHERPHQFLNGATPSSRYRTSPRPYTGTLPPIEYPGHFIVKRITNAGTFRFKRKLLFIANSLKQHTIGLEEVDDGIWSIHFCRVLLGRLDERDCIIRG